MRAISERSGDVAAGSQRAARILARKPEKSATGSSAGAPVSIDAIFLPAIATDARQRGVDTRHSFEVQEVHRLAFSSALHGASWRSQTRSQRCVNRHC
jgi:hypothetical protein